MNALINALYEEYAENAAPPRPDSTTLPGVCELVRWWFDGMAQTGELVDALERISLAVDLAHHDCGKDLEEAKDPESELVVHLERQVLAYVRLAPNLAGLKEAVNAGSLVGAQRSLARLESSIGVLREATGALEEWLCDPTPRCLSCGGREDGGNLVCSFCDLDLLVPDPGALEDGTLEAAMLGPAYSNVYDAWRDVVNGRSSLDALFRALGRLEVKLLWTTRLAHSVRTVNSTASDLFECLASSLEGIRRMRFAGESRLVRDLNEGWALLFRSAVKLGDRLRPLTEPSTEQLREDTVLLAALAS